MAEQLQPIDRPRLRRQLAVIRDVMLSAAECGSWLTLAELETLTNYPQASISAQLRHLRNGRNGVLRSERLNMEKRRRGKPGNGLWEYRVAPRLEAIAQSAKSKTT